MSEFTADVNPHNVPPPGRAEAKAAGLTVYTSLRPCIDKAHGKTRRLSDNQCMGCIKELKNLKDTLRATAWDALKQAARKAVERELKQAERLKQRIQEQEERARIREEEKAARKKARLMAKLLETKERKKAERSKQQQQQAEPPLVVDERRAFDPLTAPWD